MGSIPLELIKIRKDPEEEMLESLYYFGRMFNKIPTDFEHLTIAAFIEISKQTSKEIIELKRREKKISQKLKR